MTAPWRPPIKRADAPKDEPLADPFPTVPVAKDVDDLKAIGSGGLVTAIIAPKSGDIPVAPGTPVVVLAKSLRDSPTFKKLWRAVCLGWAAFWGYVVVQVLIAGGPFALTEAQWISLLKDATYPALLTAAGLYSLKVKLADNDAITSASLAKEPKT